MSGRIRYRIDIFGAGVQTTTGAIDFTLQTSQLRAPPILGGQLVRAPEGRVESQPWKLSVLDINSTFTAHLTNSSGRLQLLGRLTRFRSSLDSTASYSTMSVGRLTDINLAADVAGWDLTISDERYLERQTQIFGQANTASLIPRGVINTFQQIAPLTNYTARYTWRLGAKSGNLVQLIYPAVYLRPQISGHPTLGLTSSIPQLMMDDVKVDCVSPFTTMTVGNFKTLRFHNITNGTDYEVAGFGTLGPGTFIDPTIIGYLQRFNETNPTNLALIVVWPTSQPSGDVTGYLYAPTHLPDTTLPQHIGGSTGLHPGTVARNCYNGVYNVPTVPSSTSLKLRISTAAFDKWERDPHYGRVWFRITAPMTMADFLEQRIFGPYSVIPLIDSQGRIAPMPMRLPSTNDPVPATIPTISATNARTHPTWEHPSREAITAVRLRYESYGMQLDRDGNPQISPAADGLMVLTKETTRTNDNITRLGRNERTYQFGSISAGRTPVPFFAFTPGREPPPLQYAETMSSMLARQIFPVYGDGPLYVSVECQRTIDQTTHGTVNPGEYVALNLGTWPSPQTNTRGGKALLRILQRGEKPEGPVFRGLYLGPSTLGAIGTPGIILRPTTNSSRHTVILTVSSVPAGSRWLAQIAMTTSTGASAPASSSPAWQPAGTNTTATLTQTLGMRPAGRKHFVRVRAIKATRILSPWSASTFAVTAALPAPTNFATTVASAGIGTIKFTYGSSIYHTEVMIDTSTAATLTSTNRVDVVPPATTRYTFFGLSTNAKAKAGVRHRDPWGGVSATLAGTISTTGKNSTTLANLRGIQILKAKL